MVATASATAATTVLSAVAIAAATLHKERKHASNTAANLAKWGNTLGRLVPNPNDPSAMIFEPALLTDPFTSIVNASTVTKAVRNLSTVAREDAKPTLNSTYLNYATNLSNHVDQGMATAIHGCNIATGVPKSKREASTNLSLAFHLAPINTGTKSFADHCSSVEADMGSFSSALKETDTTTSRKGLPLYSKRTSIHDLICTAGNIQLFLQYAVKDYATNKNKPVIHLRSSRTPPATSGPTNKPSHTTTSCLKYCSALRRSSNTSTTSPMPPL
jgi:hypothetical protein